MLRRTFRSTLIALTLLGCANQNTGLLIGNVVAPDDQGGYSVSNAALSGGVLDVTYPRPYIAVLRLLNQTISLSANGTSGVPIADPNLIQLQAVDVELSAADGSTLAIANSSYRVAASSVTIPTSDGMTAGEGLGSAELIPLSVRDQLMAMGDGTVVVSAQAVGVTGGGAEIISPPFIFTIRVCTGCLAQCVIDDEGTQLCAPSPTPGQDFVDYNCNAPAICGLGGA